jgi:hypothetical protein
MQQFKRSPSGSKERENGYSYTIDMEREKNGVVVSS